MPEEKATGIAPALEHFSDECLDDTTRFRIIVTNREPAENFREDYDYNLVPTVIVLLTGSAVGQDDDASAEEPQEDGPILLKVGRKEFLSSLPEL